MKHSELRHQPRHVNPRIQGGKVAKIIYDGKVFDKKQKMSVRNDKK